MARKKKCVAMLLAGGQGSRLAPLTENVAKPAVPFGGRYRIIDFSLSNCVNSGIDTVGVLTQYQPLELNDYLGTGDPWDESAMGVHVFPILKPSHLPPHPVPLCLTLCNPMDCSMPRFPVHYQLPELAQTHVH